MYWWNRLSKDGWHLALLEVLTVCGFVALSRDRRREGCKFVSGIPPPTPLSRDGPNSLCMSYCLRDGPGGLLPVFQL